MPVKYIKDLTTIVDVGPEDLVVVSDPNAPDLEKHQAFKATVQTLAVGVFTLMQGLVFEVKSFQAKPTYDKPSVGQATFPGPGSLLGYLSSVEDYDAIKVGDVIRIDGNDARYEVYSKDHRDPGGINYISLAVEPSATAPWSSFFYGYPAFRKINEADEVSGYNSLNTLRTDGFVYANEVVTNKISKPRETGLAVTVEGSVQAEGLAVGDNLPVAGQIVADEIHTEKLVYTQAALVDKINTTFGTAIDIDPDTGQCSFPGMAMFLAHNWQGSIPGGSEFIISWKPGIVSRAIELVVGGNSVRLIQTGFYYVTATIQFRPTELGTLPNYSSVQTWIKKHETGVYYTRGYKYFKDLQGAGVSIAVNLAAMINVNDAPLEISVGGFSYVSGTVGWGVNAGDCTLGIVQLNGGLY